MNKCPSCGLVLDYIEHYKQWYCRACKSYQQPLPSPNVRVPIFQASVSFRSRYDQKVDLKTRDTKYDRKYNARKVFIMKKIENCHCLFTEEHFSAVEIDKVIKTTASVLPGIRFEIQPRKFEAGKEFITFNYADITDYRIIGSERKDIVLRVKNAYVIISPIDGTFNIRGLDNHELVKSIEKHYVQIGIKPKKAIGSMMEYNTGMAEYLQEIPIPFFCDREF